MTKINKLGKSTFVIAILSFLLVAVLAFGGTYAYFSAVAAPAEADITMGYLRIGTEGATWDTAAIQAIGKAVPNQPIIDANNGACTVAVDANVRYFVRAKITYSVELAEAHKNETEESKCPDAEKEVLLITANLSKAEGTGLGWLAGTYVAENSEGYYYLNTVQAATAGTHSFSITARVNPELGQVSSQHFMEAVITITVTFDVIQADYILGTNADEADKAADTPYTDVKVLEAAFERAGLNIDKPVQG